MSCASVYECCIGGVRVICVWCEGGVFVVHLDDCILIFLFVVSYTLLVLTL